MIVSTTQEMNKLSVCEPQSSGDHMHPKVHHALKIHGQKSNKNLWLNGVLRIRDTSKHIRKNVFKIKH